MTELAEAVGNSVWRNLGRIGLCLEDRNEMKLNERECCMGLIVLVITEY